MVDNIKNSREELKKLISVGKTLVVIVRHGESVGNKNKVCLGHTDLDITEKGREQAELTAKELSYVNFSSIHSSDLIRAMNTAKPHADLRGMSIIPNPNLRELYFGKWENASVDYLIEEYHDEFVYGWRGNFGTYTPPEGEQVQHMAKRIEAEIIKIASSHTGDNTLVVSHAAAIRSLWGRISGYSPEQVCDAVPFPSNASYSVVEYVNDEMGERLIPLLYSCDEHLLGLVTVIPKV